MNIFGKRLLLGLVVTIAWIVTSDNLAHAQTAGVRAGVSAAPDQVYFGAHADVAEVVDKFWFRPNIEVGVGSNATVVALNGEFVYFVPLATKNRTDWKVYVGGGPGAVIATNRGAGGGTDGGPGFNFLLGLTRSEGIFAEIKVGLLDSPEFKFGIGWSWKRK